KDCGLDRSNGTAVFETGARALLWRRLGALDRGMIGTVRLNPAAYRDRIDAFLRTDADRRDIDRVDELRGYAVIDFDDGESATHAGIDAEDSHGTPLLEFWLVRLRDCFGELACVLDVFFGARLYFLLAVFRGAYAEGHRMDGKDGGKLERVFRRMFRRIELSQHTLDRANFFGVAVSVADAFAGKRACDCGQRRGDMVEKILHGNDTQFGGG